MQCLQAKTLLGSYFFWRVTSLQCVSLSQNFLSHSLRGCRQKYCCFGNLADFASGESHGHLEREGSATFTLGYDKTSYSKCFHHEACYCKWFLFALNAWSSQIDFISLIVNYEGQGTVKSFDLNILNCATYWLGIEDVQNTEEEEKKKGLHETSWDSCLYCCFSGYIFCCLPPAILDWFCRGLAAIMDTLIWCGSWVTGGTDLLWYLLHVLLAQIFNFHFNT